MEAKIAENKRIENRFNVWWYVAVLYLSFLLGNYFDNEITLNTFINQLNMLFGTINSYTPYALGVVFRFLIPLISVGLFEIFARVFYGITNAFSLGALNIKVKDFVGVLRIFVIVSNLVMGIFNLLYFFFNFLIPLGKTVISFGVISAAYLLFFLYINKYYLDKKMAHRAFRTMALLYLVYSFFTITRGVIL